MRKVRFARKPWFGGAVLVLLGLFGPGDWAADKADKAAKVYSANASKSDLFDGTNVVRINITVPPSGMRLLQRNGWGGDGNHDNRPQAKATVTDGTHTYTNVAIHLKGAAGSFRPIFDARPAFTLNFDKFAPEQSFHGLKKLSLNNSVQDRSLMNEKLCRELFAAAGVPAPRADWAVVTLNNRPLGLYVLVEGFNKQFLHRYFKNVSGNLYDGGFCREVNEDLAVNSGDKPEDRSDLRRLLSAATASRNKNSLDPIKDILDVDRFVSMIAMEVIQDHWDGYAMNRNNYRLYHDMDTGRMVFMPHGLDQMFATAERGDLNLPITPHMNGYIASVVLGTSEGRARYLQRFGELRTNVFQVAAITNRVRQFQARIRPVLMQTSPGYVSDHDWAVNYLCQNIAERGKSLDDQLLQLTKERGTTFDSNGAARLQGWRPRNNASNNKFDISAGENGRKALHVTADPNSSTASWRTRIILKPGHYRFEGFAKTHGAGRATDGADLRISGGTPQQQLRGDTDWTKVSFEFEVPEPEGDVELVCELKGTRGEAWFDVNSLKLRRLE